MLESNNHHNISMKFAIPAKNCFPLLWLRDHVTDSESSVAILA